jgi:antitoxin VapB
MQEQAMNHPVEAATDSGRRARLFRNGRSQAVRIPREFEFQGEDVVIQRMPDGSLLLRVATTGGLSEYLQTAEPWCGGDFLEGLDDLPPMKDVRF